MADDLTESEREAIVQDLVNHWIEAQEVGAGDDVSNREIQNFEDTIRDKDSDELIAWWHTRVGEWVASRGLNPDDQFDKLKSSGIVDYGYIAPKYN